MYPFSITLLATTGEPEGIRHLDKSKWVGKYDRVQRTSEGNCPDPTPGTR